MNAVVRGCTLHTVDVYFCREDQAKEGEVRERQQALNESGVGLWDGGQRAFGGCRVRAKRKEG